MLNFLHRPLRGATLLSRYVGRSLTTTTYNAALQNLLRNAELDNESAENELRWIQDAAREGAASGLTVDEMVNQRGRGVPLQYVIGDTDFGPLRLLCRPPTLIPRPETAFVFVLLARRIGQAFDETGPRTAKLKVLDICTGSAPIPLLLGYLLQKRIDKLYALDLAPEAVKLAQDNLILQRKMNGRMPSIDIWQASMLSSTFVQDSLSRMKGPVDIITANPPYISTLDYASLPSSVKDHEDSRALIAEDNGLQFYRKIVEMLPRLLSPRGDVDEAGIPRVAVEIGHEQADDVRDLMESKSDGRIKRTECWQDQWEKDRLVVGYGR